MVILYKNYCVKVVLPVANHEEKNAENVWSTIHTYIHM